MKSTTERTPRKALAYKRQGGGEVLRRDGKTNTITIKAIRIIRLLPRTAFSAITSDNQSIWNSASVWQIIHVSSPYRWVSEHPVYYSSTLLPRIRYVNRGTRKGFYAIIATSKSRSTMALEQGFSPTTPAHLHDDDDDDDYDDHDDDDDITIIIIINLM
jgi:hypothetical protein